MYGRQKQEELPWGDLKCSPMTVRLRIIMDLSYPHWTRQGKGQLCSSNEGMANYEEFEPVAMASDVKWRRCIYRAGRPEEMMKVDYDMACLILVGGPPPAGGGI